MQKVLNFPLSSLNGAYFLLVKFVSIKTFFNIFITSVFHILHNVNNTQQLSWPVCLLFVFLFTPKLSMSLLTWTNRKSYKSLLTYTYHCWWWNLNDICTYIEYCDCFFLMDIRIPLWFPTMIDCQWVFKTAGENDRQSECGQQIVVIQIFFLINGEG